MRNTLVAIAFTSISATAVAKTPYVMDETEKNAFHNVFEAEIWAVWGEGKPNILSGPDAPEVTKLMDMYQAFHKNEIAVHKTYVGKPVRYTIPLGRVALENNKPVVYGAWSKPTVRYAFTDESADELAKANSQMIVKCTLKSITRSELQFTNCSVDLPYVQSFMRQRESEYLDYLSGTRTPSLRSFNTLVTIFAFIRSQSPIHSDCLKPAGPNRFCMTNLERGGQKVIKTGVWQQVESEFKALDFDR